MSKQVLMILFFFFNYKTDIGDRCFPASADLPQHTTLPVSCIDSPCLPCAASFRQRQLYSTRYPVRQGLGAFACIENDSQERAQLSSSVHTPSPAVERRGVRLPLPPDDLLSKSFSPIACPHKDTSAYRPAIRARAASRVAKLRDSTLL